MDDVVGTYRLARGFRGTKEEGSMKSEKRPADIGSALPGLHSLPGQSALRQ